MAEVKNKVVTVESLAALHEYNKETYFSVDNTAELASTIESLIANGGMSTLQSAVQMTKASGITIDFSGTGKGKLFISVAGNSSFTLTDAITIDGNVIGSCTGANGAIEIEFLENFNLTTSGGSTHYYCTAVFY